jgi:hypothetical protein
MANQTYELPQNLGDLMGAYDEAHWQTVVAELKPDTGVLVRGTVLASGAAGDAGKLVKLTAGTEAAAYGILLDPSVDTSAAFSDGSVTGSIARAGSFKGPALIVPTGINVITLTTRLRELGIFTEGAIVVPAAAQEAEVEAEAPAA